MSRPYEVEPRLQRLVDMALADADDIRRRHERSCREGGRLPTRHSAEGPLQTILEHGGFDPSVEKGKVYVIAVVERDPVRGPSFKTGEPVKVGFSRNPYRRVAQLQTGNANELEVWWTWPAPQFVERLLHSALSELRATGEWFRLTSDAELFLDGWNLALGCLYGAANHERIISPAITPCLDWKCLPAIEGRSPHRWSLAAA